MPHEQGAQVEAGSQVVGVARSEFHAPLRHFASGGECPVAEGQDQIADRGEDALIALPEQGGEDVLADLVAPEMVATITPRHVGRVEIHPVDLLATLDPVPPRADVRSVELQTALQAIRIDAERSEVDRGFGHAEI
jgi:hypothetical protein